MSTKRTPAKKAAPKKSLPVKLPPRKRPPEKKQGEGPKDFSVSQEFSEADPKQLNQLFYEVQQGGGLAKFLQQITAARTGQTRTFHGNANTQSNSAYGNGSLSMRDNNLGEGIRIELGKGPINQARGMISSELSSIYTYLRDQERNITGVRTRLQSIGHFDHPHPEILDEGVIKDLQGGNTAAQITAVRKVCAGHNTMLERIIDHIDFLFADLNENKTKG